MLQEGSEVLVNRALLNDGDSEYLDDIPWESGLAKATVEYIYTTNPDRWNTSDGWDIEVKFDDTGMCWGCHMRAIVPRVLNKSVISVMLVKQYEI